MGKLLVIEGLDGSGKDTQTRLLSERLKAAGQANTVISLPHYEDDSSALVKLYLGGAFGSKPGDVNAYAASSFYAVDRYAGYKTRWGASYESGGVILANRYTTSNACHQMTKLPRENWDAYLDWLFTYEYDLLGIPKPDGVIYLDMPVEVSQKLLAGRYAGDEGKKDVHERDVAYLAACHEAAAYCAKALGWQTIRCAAKGEPKPVAAIADEVFACARAILNETTGE